MDPDEPISVLGLHEPPYGLNPIYAIALSTLFGRGRSLLPEILRSSFRSWTLHDVDESGRSVRRAD
jgi:hypothetical protein